MFIIIEEYYVDGGQGDAVYAPRPIGIAETEEEAKEYVKLFSCEHIYDIPYSDLKRGGLSYYELPLISVHNDILNTTNWHEVYNNIDKLESYRQDIKRRINGYGSEDYKESLSRIESKLKELNDIIKNEMKKEFDKVLKN